MPLHQALRAAYSKQGATVVSTVSKGASAIANSVIALVLANALESTGNGVFAGATAVALMLTPLAQMSARVGVVAVAAALQDAPIRLLLRSAERMLTGALLLAVSVGALLVVVAVPADDRLLGFLALAMLPAVSLNALSGARWWASGRPAAPDVLVVGQSLTRLLLVLGLYWTDNLTPRSAIIVVVSSMLLSAIVGTFVSRLQSIRNEQGDSAGDGADRSHTRQILAACVPAMVAGLVLAGLLRIDILMLGKSSVSQAEIGAYALAARILEISWITSLAFGQVYFVRGGQALRADSSASTRSSFALAASSSSSFIVGCGLTALMWLFGERLVGPTFDEVPKLMVLALPGVAAYAALPVARGDLFLRHRFLAVAASMGGALTINIVLNLLLIPRFAASGAAVATSVSYIAAILFVQFAKREAATSGISETRVA